MKDSGRWEPNIIGCDASKNVPFSATNVMLTSSSVCQNLPRFFDIINIPHKTFFVSHALFFMSINIVFWPLFLVIITYSAALAFIFSVSNSMFWSPGFITFLPKKHMCASNVLISAKISWYAYKDVQSNT